MTGPQPLVAEPSPADRAAPARFGLLDYGSGNLHSAGRALTAAVDQVASEQRAAGQPRPLEVVVGGPEVVGDVLGLVVPGVGSFAACMAGLTSTGADALIRERHRAARPMLGICVGHQVLFEQGTEHGEQTPGLGLLPGRVEPLTSARLPHMGWNQARPERDDQQLLETDERYYFVHSYGVHQGVEGAVTGWAEHGGDRFVASVEAGHLWSTQFHPEKSDRAGARLLQRWVRHVLELSDRAGSGTGLQ